MRRLMMKRHLGESAGKVRWLGMAPVGRGNRGAVPLRSVLVPLSWKSGARKGGRAGRGGRTDRRGRKI